jgi:hypothetical protein
MLLQELGVTFDSDLLDQFIELVQQGYKADQIRETMNLSEDVMAAVVQAYFSALQ